ncbi:MAG: sigma-70 family RNA polymerase sigma factor [Verrucomicrobiota bacterium]
MSASDPHFTEFARTGSEEAFRRLVGRHMGMVHSAARRLLGNRGDAAADVAQTVFSQLARRAGTLPPDLVVSIWLHTQTRRAALNVIRGETRRAARERAAADLLQMNAPDPDSARVSAALMPHIDHAIAGLPRVDQQALALRFFEQCGLQEIGDRLGLSAEAVKKRLARALEKLRARLSRRGVTLSAAALTFWLSHESVQAVPASLTASGLATAAMQPAAQGAGGFFSILTFMTGIKSILIGTVLGLAGGGFWAVRQDTGHPASSGGAASSSSAFPLPGGETGAAVRQRFTAPPAARGVDGLVDQLHSLIAAPDNELTRQRFAAWLAEVPPDLWKPLMTLAESRLSYSECGRWLPEVAAAWAKRDPVDAVLSLSGMFQDRIHLASQLAASAFQEWHASSPVQALNWMMEHQDDPRLARSLPPIITVVAGALAAQSSDDAVRWASRLQGNDLREAALLPVWNRLKEENNPGAWGEVCGKLMREEDAGFQRLALKQAIDEWCDRGSSAAAGCAGANQWLASLPPSPERSVAAEFLLGNVLNARDYPLKDPSPALIAALREADPRHAADAVVKAVRKNPAALSGNARQSLLPLIPAPEREDVMLQGARKLAFGQDEPRYSRPDTALQWAAELSDAAVRDPLVYAIARQWLRQHQSGELKNDPGQWKEAAALPPAVQERMRDARQDFEAGGKP